MNQVSKTEPADPNNTQNGNHISDIIKVESILIAVTRISTFKQDQLLTNATGFFLERDQKLFVVTNRHVVTSPETGHTPDRIELELHINAQNIAEVTAYSIPLYKNAQPIWKEAQDTAGLVDIVAIEIDRKSLPKTFVYRAFELGNFVEKLDVIEVGTPLLIVGFPLGFHDTLHKLPVARQAIISSAFGLRFQGMGYFLTDARLHRGTSGAPVVARSTRQSGRNQLPFLLLGVHSARLDVAHDTTQDERLALNVAWYADVLTVITDPNFQAPSQQIPPLDKQLLSPSLPKNNVMKTPPQSERSTNAASTAN